MPLPTKRSIPRAIGIATLIAGTLDIADALIFFGIRNHLTPIPILQNIASHVVGRSVYHGGLTTAFAGLVVHFLITAFWATLFILAARRIQFLWTKAIASGLLYGFFIYVFMNYVVLPHITLPTHPSHLPAFLINGVLALLLFMGLPIALVNRRFAPPPQLS